MFPKSLAEVSDEDSRQRFAENLAICGSDEIFFLITYARRDQDVWGVKEFQDLSDKLRACGFEYDPKDSIDTYQPQNPLNQGLNIQEYCSGFRYPQEIQDFVTALRKKCFESDAGCSTCRVTFSPMLKDNYIAYKVIRFQRKTK